MRMRMMLLGGALLMATGGCATTRSDGTHDSRTAWDKTRDGFGVAYNGVKTGAKEVAHVGGWVLEKAGDGVVRVVNKKNMGKFGGAVADSWITSKLKGEYGLDPEVKAGHINIDTSGGVVTLTGMVSSEYEAQAAIRRALDTRGVREVRSNLSWATTDQARIFEKGDDVNLRSRQ